MSTTTAQRRGKPLTKAEATILIEDGGAATSENSNTVGGGSSGGEPTIRKATVRRRLCGTGPFDRYWLNLDCCGLFCALITYCLHAYGVYAVCIVLLPPWMSETTDDGVRILSRMGMIHETLFAGIAVMAVVSHFVTMTTDPGAVPPDAKPLETAEVNQAESSEETKGLIPPAATKKLCRRCRAFKPQRAHHCSICRRCIIKMDHHCPWVNNCVGVGNHKFFLLFVFYTFLSCTYAIILVITRFSTCMERPHHAHGVGRHSRHYNTCLDKPTQLLAILGLLIESLLFGMFTSCMMVDQSGVVFSKLTHIDRLKGVDIGGSLAGITEVFGVGRRGVNSSSFRLDWLSPFARVCFPPSVRDEVMGFCRPIPKAPSPMTELMAAPSPSSGPLSQQQQQQPTGTAGRVVVV